MRHCLRQLLAGLTLLSTLCHAHGDTDAGARPATGTGTGTGTNIIGSAEAPTVLNIVPWKDRDVRLERKDPTTPLLDRVLEPLEPEVLQREIQYHQRLTTPSE